MVINIKMESDPIEEAEAIIPMEIVSSVDQSDIEEPEAIIPNLTVSSGTVRLVRKVARRTESWYPQPPPPPRRSTRRLGKKSPRYFESLPPQAKDIPATARKKRRIEESLPPTKARTIATTTEEAATNTPSPDVSVDLPPPAVENCDDAKADPLTDMQPNAGANRATGSWTSEEDAKLTSALANTSKKKYGKEYKIDWAAVAALVPSRTHRQCRNRWQGVLDSNIDPTTARAGKWTAVEDNKLKDAVQTHGGEDWGAIAALVPGRTRKQCCMRWHDTLNPSIALTAGREGKWTADEDNKLKDAVQTHGGKNWDAIAALVPGRMSSQCCNRWHDALNPNIDPTTARAGKWTAVEDSKLKDAIQTHGGKNWDAIAALVLGRTKIQCYNRWHDVLDPSIDRTTGRMGKWLEAEDSKLQDAVKAHGDQDWAAIAALVPGRTNKQCRCRCYRFLDRSSDRASGRTGN
jgi:hypothetical protein